MNRFNTNGVIVANNRENGIEISDYLCVVFCVFVWCLCDVFTRAVQRSQIL